MAIRVGILGAGGMGKTHATRLSTIKGVSVDAICSLPIDQAQAVNAGVLGGKAQAFGSFQKMVDSVPLDALYVCLPPFAHDGQVEYAAQKGLHLFLEKPIALTPERAAAQVKAIEKAGVMSQVGYHMRFAKGVVQLKKMLDNGQAGAPSLFTAAYLCNALHGTWWRNPKKSGGQILEQIIHLYDMAIYLLGEPKTACGFAGNLQHQDVADYQVEDTSASIIQFKSGAIATIAGSNAAVPTRWDSPFRVVCQKVVAEFRDLHDVLLTKTGGRRAEDCWKTGKMPETTELKEPVDCYLEEDKYFIKMLQGKAPPIAPAREGLLGVQLTTAVVQSAKAGGKPFRV
jgi:predicted dehydrogenase